MDIKVYIAFLIIDYYNMMSIRRFMQHEKVGNKRTSGVHMTQEGNG